MKRSPMLPDSPPSPSQKPRFRRWRFLLGAALGIGTFGVSAVILTGVGLYAHLSANLPSVDALQHYKPPVVSRLYTADDQLMAELSHERRIYVPIRAIPPLVRNAFIAAEDQNFYSHGGVDPLAMLRAGVTDIFSILTHQGKRPLGASTITQQVAKVMLLNNNSLTIERKVREALLAMRIEHTLSKDRILEIYLNGIYLGNGAYGVEAAAQTYFNKTLDQLSDAEAAMLASMPKSPSNYNPFLHPKAAMWRRNWVLDRMGETHAIPADEAQQAKQDPLVPQGQVRFGPLAGSEWFAAEVRRQLTSLYNEEQTTEGGLDVHTSLDPHLQQVSTKLLREGLMAYARTHEGWHGAVGHLDGDAMADWQGSMARQKNPAGMLSTWRLAVVLSTTPAPRVGWVKAHEAHTATLRKTDETWSRRTHPLQTGDLVMIEPQDDGSAALEQIPQVEGATVTLDAHTGRVLALVGGWSFQQSQFNRVTQAQRQPGSSFKPLVYLAAMERDISPSETFDDSPISFGDWKPQNYEHDNWGPTTLHDALRESRNLVTIRVAAHLGMKAVSDMAVRSGMVDNMPPYLPAALGAVETTVLREAGAYAAIANGGHSITPSLIDYIQNPDGTIIWRNQANRRTVTTENGMPVIHDGRPVLASPQSAFQITTMMRDVIARGTGVRAGVGIDRPIAGKTGTSQDYHDAWFAGFSPDTVTVVWIGYDAPRSLGKNETGGHLAGPIWNGIMKAVFATRPRLEFPAPDGITLAEYDTGRIRATDAFKPNQIPGASVPLHGFGAGTQALTAADTGADMIPDSETDMPSSSPSSSGTITDPLDGTMPSHAPASLPAALPQEKANPAEGGDIGVGGLY
ncbi:PBP1A family penicillin-binding protein [Parasaccharibacter sp. TMW 2.1888]|uniref:penicillin-binding protein 1A n=1 Tax=Parasaccharibacter sp. TMW 2.1888 TaxID=2268025 RepID=UPI00206AA46B|nr:PBP1A family penicillin-binding protein [Parasaccharibacter sp. TMW 2.1888]UPO79818.1 PBP1A family penicillin-binding protein [Parasaccharibacter sp. TMW 2.1888]